MSGVLSGFAKWRNDYLETRTAAELQQALFAVGAEHPDVSSLMEFADRLRVPASDAVLDPGTVLVFGLDHQRDPAERLRWIVFRAWEQIDHYAEWWAERELAIRHTRKHAEEMERVQSRFLDDLDRLGRLRLDMAEKWSGDGSRQATASRLRFEEARGQLVAVLSALTKDIEAASAWSSHDVVQSARSAKVMQAGDDADDEADDREEETEEDDWPDYLASSDVTDAPADTSSDAKAAVKKLREQLQQPGLSASDRDRLERLREGRERESWALAHAEFYAAPQRLREVHRPDRVLLLRLGEVYSAGFGRPAVWYLNDGDVDPWGFAVFVDRVLRCVNWPRTEDSMSPRPRGKAEFAGKTQKQPRSDLVVSDDALRSVARSFPPGHAADAMQGLADAAAEEKSAWRMKHLLLSQQVMQEVPGWLTPA